MTAPASTLRLTTAVGSYPHTRALKERPSLPGGVELEHIEVTPISDAFKRMCRRLEFDVSEMSITGYLLGRVYGKGFTALPVFPVRAFGSSHAAITCNTDAGVREPRDLEGKRAGARAYTGAASFWVRGVLMHEYGLDADKVTWVSGDEEHVIEYQADAPPNAVYQLGADLNQMLLGGALAAGIGLSAKGPHIQPLIPDARAAALASYRRTGVYQINHVIVVRDQLLAEHPALAETLFNAFQAAKEAWLATSPDLSSTRDLDLPSGDPLPYGIAANRASLQALVQYAAEQRILPRPYTIDEFFPLSFDPPWY
jgi:4,5-dihydroxyphthalate decarboxylase